MSTSIPNVKVDKSLCNYRLATTGIHTCIAFIVHLNNNKTFISHMSPQNFNLESMNPKDEVQLLIEKAILKLTECKIDSFLEHIYIIGGLNNIRYRGLNDELSELRINYSTVMPITEHLNVNDLRNFIKLIKYSNITMNIGEDDDAEADASTFVSDLTIISDRTSVPPILFMAHYFGPDQDLRAGVREFKPWILYMFDVTLMGWYIINRVPSDHEQSQDVLKMLNEFKNGTTNKLPDNELFCTLADGIVDTMIPNIKH